MKAFTRSVGLLCLALGAGCMVGGAPNPQVAAKANPAAGTWLQLVDAGNYTGSWAQASAFFRSALTEQEWVRSMAAFRAPMGSLLDRKPAGSRYSTAMPGAPDGQYVLLQYQTRFAHKQTAVESVTVMADTDGVWRVSGYFIK